MRSPLRTIAALVLAVQATVLGAAQETMKPKKQPYPPVQEPREIHFPTFEQKTLANGLRVVVIEHFNARRLSAADLPGPVDIVVIDVSFISLRHILPVVPPLLTPGADVIALVKPQFEAGRDEVGKGVIRDETVQARVLAEVAGVAREVGLTPVTSTPSPITGAKGNVEFLLHLRSASDVQTR